MEPESKASISQTMLFLTSKFCPLKGGMISIPEFLTFVLSGKTSLVRTTSSGVMLVALLSWRLLRWCGNCSGSLCLRLKSGSFGGAYCNCLCKLRRKQKRQAMRWRSCQLKSRFLGSLGLFPFLCFESTSHGLSCRFRSPWRSRSGGAQWLFVR